jgi:hypothetical protein
MAVAGVAGVAGLYVDSGVAAIVGVAAIAAIAAITAITAITAINGTEGWRMFWVTTLVWSRTRRHVDMHCAPHSPTVGAHTVFIESERFIERNARGVQGVVDRFRQRRPA